MTPALHSAARHAAILLAFSLVATFVLMSTHYYSKDRIQHNTDLAMADQLQAVLPLNLINNPLQNSTESLPARLAAELQSPSALRYVGKKEGANVAYVYPVTVNTGYAGGIDLLVGVLQDGSVSGVRVIKHKETPGLGDYIDVKKSPWIHQFEGKTLQTRWKVKKDGGDIDAMAGATITARAVTEAVARVLRVHQQLK